MAKDNMQFLQGVADDDVRTLRDKDVQYGSSWKRRGGVGAFMMMARKWDRIETALAPSSLGDECNLSASLVEGEGGAGPYDIFKAVELDPRDEGLLDDIRDLRRYLLLVESELLARAAHA